jgi:hypothetical protein
MRSVRATTPVVSVSKTTNVASSVRIGAATPGGERGCGAERCGVFPSQ